MTRSPRPVPRQSAGVPASPSGHSAEPEPIFVVSAVPVSVPNADEFKLNLAPQFFILRDDGNRELLRINITDGTVEGEVEDASEAARVFVEYLRQFLASAMSASGQDAQRLETPPASAVRVVLLCDETGKNAQCQEVAVVADADAFAAYAKAEYRNARGNPERGYSLYGPDGEDLNFTLVTMEYDVLTASAIEARRAETAQTGSVADESAVPERQTPQPVQSPPSITRR